jgi:hypothetical protein
VRDGKGYGVTTIPFEEVAKFPDVEIDHLDEFTATCESLVEDIYKKDGWMTVFEHAIVDENGVPITFKHSHEIDGDKYETNRYQSVIDRPVKEGSTKPLMDGSAACRIHNFADRLVDYMFNGISADASDNSILGSALNMVGNIFGGQKESDNDENGSGDSDSDLREDNVEPKKKRGRKKKKQASSAQPKIRKSRIYSQRGKYVVTGITILKSIPDAREQARHIDYKPHKRDADGSKTDYAILVPIKTIGSFSVWEESHHVVQACKEVDDAQLKPQVRLSKVREILANNPNFTVGIDNCKKRKIRIGQDEMCVFVGNAVHAGAENEKQVYVYRLHIYVSRVDVEAPDNYTVVPNEIVWELTQEGAQSEDIFNEAEEEEAEPPQKKQKRGRGRPRK